jgi:hypothetical protein
MPKPTRAVTPFPCGPLHASSKAIVAQNIKALFILSLTHQTAPRTRRYRGSSPLVFTIKLFLF